MEPTVGPKRTQNPVDGGISYSYQAGRFRDPNPFLPKGIGRAEKPAFGQVLRACQVPINSEQPRIIGLGRIATLRNPSRSPSAVSPLL